MSSDANDDKSRDFIAEPLKSVETEAVILEREASRRKPLSADKRKRNETLAIGLSRAELLISDSENMTKGIEVHNMEISLFN